MKEAENKNLEWKVGFIDPNQEVKLNIELKMNAKINEGSYHLKFPLGFFPQYEWN